MGVLVYVTLWSLRWLMYCLECHIQEQRLEKTITYSVLYKVPSCWTIIPDEAQGCKERVKMLLYDRHSDAECADYFRISLAGCLKVKFISNMQRKCSLGRIVLLAVMMYK